MMSEFVKSLSLTLVFGAAMNDATPEQRQRIRDEIKPLFDQFREDGKTIPILKKIQGIMGPQWTPSGEYGQYLKKLREK